MPGYLGLKHKFLPNLRQYEATTGRPISDRAQQNYLYAALQTEADRADQNYWRNKQFGLQSRGLDIQEKAYADQAGAARISGITQLANLPLQGYLGYKVLQSSGLIGGTTAQGALGAGVGGTAQAATAGIGLPGSYALGNAGPASAVDAGATAGGAAGTGTGLLTTVGAPAAAGFLGGSLGEAILGTGRPGRMGGERHTAGALGGAVAGAALGSVVPGIGTVVGGLIGGAAGFISSLF